MRNTIRYKMFGTAISINDVVDKISETGQKEILLEPKIIGYIQDDGIGMPRMGMRGELKCIVNDKKINLTKYIYNQLSDYEGFGSREKHTQMFMSEVDKTKHILSIYGIEAKIAEPQQV